MNFSLLNRLLKRQNHKVILAERGCAYFRQKTIDKYGEAMLRSLNGGECEIRAIEDYEHVFKNK